MPNIGTLAPILDLQCRDGMRLLSRLARDFDTPEARTNAKREHVASCDRCRVSTESAGKPRFQQYAVSIKATVDGEVKYFAQIVRATSSSAALMQYLADHDFAADVRVYVRLAPEG